MQCSIVQVAQTLAGQYDNVQIPQLSAMLSERLTGDALDLVTVYRTPNIFLGNDQTQPCVAQRVLSGQQQQTGS